MLSDILGQQPVLQDQMIKERSPQQYRVGGKFTGQPAIAANTRDHTRPQAVEVPQL